MKKIILIAACFVVIAGSVGFYLYNKPHPSMHKMKISNVASSHDVISAYQKNELQANEIFLGKVISLSGEIQSIESNDPITIVLKGSDMLSSVRCQLDHLSEHPRLKQLKPSDQITVKGICTGYLMDVVVDRCIITNPS